MRRLVKFSLIAITIALPAAAVTLGVVKQRTNGLAPDSMRQELSREIVTRWKPYVDKTYGTAASDWSKRMQPTFQTTDIANLERALGAESFVDMTDALFGGRRAVDGRISPAQVQARTQGKKTTAGLVTSKAFGSPGSDLVYTPLTPCRIIDTRLVGGPLAAESTRNFRAFTSTDFTAQGGAPGNCGIPQNVSAVTVTIASQAATSSGYFTAFPFSEAMPVAATLNYNISIPGINVYSNAADIRLCRPGCASEFSVYSKAQAQLIVDVTGYFAEPEATALDCTVASESGSLALLSGLQPKSVTCPAGYTSTGGGCGGVLGVAVSNAQPLVVGGQPVGYRCDLVGSLLGILGYEVSATCCRLPGR